MNASLQMNATIRAMLAPGKGILAADESTRTIEKRFASVNVPSTEETRRDYREMLFRAPGIGNYISGVILYEETLFQKARDETPLVEILKSQGVIPGIKVDKGTVPLALHPEELVTEGLDGLDERIKKYKAAGARFAKWRAVIAIGENIPTEACIHANAHALARYAAISQSNEIVPIVEPEVLIDGNHTIEQCFAVSERTLGILFDEIRMQGVSREHLLLKASMVLPGKASPAKAPVSTVAEQTIRCMKNAVPPDVPGIAFLSGGQSEEEATAHLNAMNAKGAHPWTLTFSYARALQNSALHAWMGKGENVQTAQGAFLRRAKLNSAAERGAYTATME